MNKGKPFFDTNVIVYAFQDGAPKQQAALDLLAAGGMTSVQVLNEFANVARRKLGFDWAEIEDAVAAVCVLLPDPSPLRLQTHLRALNMAERFGASFYDALVIATAVESRCAVLYTEDLQHGQRIEGTQILNPFL
jgi:predicted nucleic acid-binding protein